MVTYKLKNAVASGGIEILNGRGGNGETLLHNASFAGNLEIVKYLVEECHCEVHSLDDEQHTPIHNAAHEGFTLIVRFLASQPGCVTDAKDIKGRAPMHYASQNGHFDVVRVLVEEFGCSGMAADIKWSHPSTTSQCECVPAQRPGGG